ncbi:MAG: hypothetical protein R3D52_11125 [Xanthobacteraceae bacterium]
MPGLHPPSRGRPGEGGKTTYNDWLFVTVLLLVAVTGFFAQITRAAELPHVAYPTYFVHLVLVFFLLVYSPYSKFAHVFIARRRC